VHSSHAWFSNAIVCHEFFYFEIKEFMTNYGIAEPRMGRVHSKYDYQDQKLRDNWQLLEVRNPNIIRCNLGYIAKNIIDLNEVKHTGMSLTLTMQKRMLIHTAYQQAK